MFSWLDAKETKTGKDGNKYTYNLTTREVIKDNGRQEYRVGFADNTNEFLEIVNENK